MKPDWKKLRATIFQWCRANPRRASVIGVVVIGLAILLIRGSGANDPALLVYHTVKRGDFLVSIIEGGTLKAVNEVMVRCEMEGVSRIISIVPEGTVAHKGDLLVELDSADLRERISSQEVVFQNTQFAYIQAKENLAIQKSVVESSIKSAELLVEFAKSDLAKYKEGDWPQLKKNTEAKITIAAEEETRAKNRCEWTDKLFAKGYATKSDLEADTLTVKRKGIELDQAKEELRLLEKYDYPKKLRALEAGLDSQTVELERVRKRSEAQIAQYEASLRSQKATLDLQEKRLNDLKAQLELTKIRAPQDGLVVYASSSGQGNGILIEEGATVRQRQDIIKLPDMTKMMVEVRVHESHVQKIKPGLTAWVTIDSLPDQQFHATVRKVAVLPDSSSRYFNPNLKVYVTEVLVEDELPDMKPGISARAEIVITNLHDVLTVPIQAVTTIKGQQVCLVENGSRGKPVQVEVGMFNDRLIEVQSGLKAGDRVQLSAMSEGDNIDMSGSIVGADGEATNKTSGRTRGGRRPVAPLPKTNHLSGPLIRPGTNRPPGQVELKKVAPVAALSPAAPAGGAK
jgi:HlyD family secretion protein